LMLRWSGSSTKFKIVKQCVSAHNIQGGWKG
jgi:hypothetical protein